MLLTGLSYVTSGCAITNRYQSIHSKLFAANDTKRFIWMVIRAHFNDLKEKYDAFLLRLVFFLYIDFMRRKETRNGNYDDWEFECISCVCVAVPWSIDPNPEQIFIVHVFRPTQMESALTTKCLFIFVANLPFSRKSVNTEETKKKLYV